MYGSCSKSVEPEVNTDQSNHSVSEQFANLIGQQTCCKNPANPVQAIAMLLFEGLACTKIPPVGVT